MLEKVWSRAVLRALEVPARVAVGNYAVGSSLDVALAVTAFFGGLDTNWQYAQGKNKQ